MNSADKRIEETLNKGGQTISDLPRKQGESVSEPYSGEERKRANGTAWKWYLNIDTDMDDYDSIRSKMILKLYILHLTDVIDRLETALENVCGERDYLLHLIKKTRPCWVCVHKELLASQHPCNTCRNVKKSDPYFEYAGVPEDWSLDDE